MILTLIDTAGRSPRDVGAIKELATAVARIPPIETHLVVAAASTATVIEDLANRYCALNPTRLLFTKLDEVDEAPELARAPARLSLPITWVTTGQSVPEDIEEPTSARVLELATAGLARYSAPRPPKANQCPIRQPHFAFSAAASSTERRSSPKRAARSR